jgi:prepilin-type N-terminal cleavage/methylation domain-containing protein
MKKKLNKKSAFTLIEILSVIVIMGILTTVGVVAFSNFSNAAKEKVTENVFKNIGTSLNSEFSKCLLNKSAVILNGHKCNNLKPPDTLAIEDFYNKNNIKNPYDSSKNVLGKDSCVAGTIVIKSPSVGNYNISYVNKSNQTITANINSTWSVVNTNASNVWTPINTGASNCWVPINTGATNVWTTVVTGANNIWTAIKP